MEHSLVVLKLFLLGYVIVTLFMVILNSIFRLRLSHQGIKPCPKISVLIPARNESQNLQKHLPLWLTQTYSNYEILVLNDASEDSTAEVLNTFANRVKVLTGLELPQGWFGKNWACHQLSQKASGDIFLFVDADVAPNGNAIETTVATLHQHKLDAFSAFLKQSFTHWTSKAVIPWAFQFPILAWPPLFLSRFIRSSALSIGNGQWFCFKKECYWNLGGHSTVKDSVIEDISLAKILHKNKHNYRPFIAPELATVTMYQSTQDLQEGLTKNLASIYGKNLIENFIFFGLFLALFVSLFFYSGLLFILVLSAFYLVQLTFRQRGINFLLIPLGLPMTLALFVQSLLAKRNRQLYWKGRKLG